MTPASTEGQRILIIDDTPGNIKILSLMLTRQNYLVDTANNGPDAFTVLADHKPDMILLDVMMPGMNGYEFCRALKTAPETQDIPVVFISALNETADKLKAFQVGGVDYITKPFQVQEVLARVSTHLMLRQLQQELQTTNHALEQRVTERTAQLLQANQDLKQQISERQRVEESLRKSEATYRTFFESSKDAVFISTPLGHIEDINSAGLSMLGYTSAEIAQLNVIDFCVSPRDWERLIKAMQVDGAVKDFELKLKTQSGKKLDCLVTATVRQTAQGETMGYQGIIRDITERKQAERERLLLLSIQRELGIAQEIQESLLPPPDPGWDNIDVACHTTPAREMGGDLYAYFAFTQTTPTGLSPHYALAVGDVSGKGMPAALLMAVSLATFRSLVQQPLQPKEFLTRMDTVLYDYTNRTHQNCAFVYMDITPLGQAEEGTLLRLANAGCVTPLIKRGDGQVEWIDIGGLPLGIGVSAEMAYSEAEMTLVSGDMIVLTSDGVIEANNEQKEMFGFERLEAAVLTGPQDEAQSMLEHILYTLHDFVGYTEPHDDITIMVVKV